MFIALMVIVIGTILISAALSAIIVLWALSIPLRKPSPHEKQVLGSEGGE
jgi:hypothetical protein